MPTYAADTSVSPEKSRAEIERTLERYGASSFAYAVTADHAEVGFRVGTATVRMTLALPPLDDFARTPQNRIRKADEQRAAHRKAVMQRWRALALTVKAKLEAVEAGIATFEEEWFAYLVLPGGATVYEQAGPNYRAAIEQQAFVPLLQLEQH